MSDSTEEKENGSSKDKHILQEWSADLNKSELELTKNRLQSLLAQQQIEATTNQHIGTNSENTELTGNMLGPDQRESREFQIDFTKNSASFDLQQYDEKEEHLHHTEMRISQIMKRRKKKVSKTL